jgi:glutamine synthetase
MIVEYVWLDGAGKTRSKTKMIYGLTLKEVREKNNLPLWNYDGSSTGQADTNNSEVLLKPQVVFPDPFRGGDCLMALCDTYRYDESEDELMVAHPSNTRYPAEQFFKKKDIKKHEPIFGIEQEFFLESKDGKILAFSEDTMSQPPPPQGQYYCSAGGRCAIGRECVDLAVKRCILAGLKVTGMNAEVAPSQWEIQICESGINAADQLVMMRYILDRTAERFGLSVNYEPMPKMLVASPGSWNGSGCHVNFSTKAMREDGGYNVILDAMPKLEAKHDEHMRSYGEGNEQRMTGKNETSAYGKFSYGVGDRGASVRIPRETQKKGCGYLEDRRPASNMDPYMVTSLLTRTICENQ